MENEHEEIFSIEQIQQMFPELWKMRNVYFVNGDIEGAYQPRNLFDKRMIKAVQYIEDLKKDIEKAERMKNKKWKTVLDWKNVVHIIYLLVSLYAIFFR